MKRLIALITLAAPSLCATAQTPLLDAMTARWNTFIFVSTKMPRQSLVELAREASQAQAVIVLTGFGGTEDTLVSTQTFAAEINNICCQQKPARWIVDPVLTRRYKVVGAPTFVVGHGKSDSPNEFSKVAGEFSLAQALKLIAQGSRVTAASEFAKRVYTSTYGERF
ncbi:MAG: type VI secretion protein [Ralstonia sp.]|jgi:conjugal transfer pilus assembly protein TrbC|nr:MAG: type VI secretion protein [Ralstonia sp.]